MRYGFPSKRSGISPTHLRALFPQQGIEADRQRSDIIRQRDTRATTHVIKGVTEVIGAGELLIDVSFPHRFLERPIFTYGGEMVPGSTLTDNNWPIVSAIVAYWDVESPDLAVYGAPLREYYRGAKLAVVTQGPDDMSIFLHWLFTGMALVNPTSSGGSSIPELGESGGTIT